MNALDAIDKYGLPITIVVLLAVFWKRDIWPFLTTQINTWQAERTAERKQYIDSINALTTVATESHATHAALMREQAMQLQSLTKSVSEIALMVEANYNVLHLSPARNEKKAPRAAARRAN